MIYVDWMYLELGYLMVDDSSSCFFLTTTTTMMSSVNHSSWLMTNQLLRASTPHPFIAQMRSETQAKIKCPVLVNAT
jgi:hypothetical protein